MDEQAFAIRINGLIWQQIVLSKAMEAENPHRERCGLAQAYGEQAFTDCANEIGRLAEALAGR